MRLFFRLLLWLSISVLSFQGGAAKACGHMEQAQRAIAVVSGHQHHQAAAATSDAHCGKAGAKAHGASHHGSSHSKCANCASCCVGAVALPAMPPGLHAPSLAAAPDAIPEAAIISIVPSALERPPRRLFV